LTYPRIFAQCKTNDVSMFMEFSCSIFCLSQIKNLLGVPPLITYLGSKMHFSLKFAP